MWHTLTKLGYLRSLMPIETNNSTAHGIITNKIIPKATKVVNMQITKIKNNSDFIGKWEKNFATYRTKHHPGQYSLQCQQKLWTKSWMCKQQAANHHVQTSELECQHPEHLQKCAEISEILTQTLGNGQMIPSRSNAQMSSYGITSKIWFDWFEQSHRMLIAILWNSQMNTDNKDKLIIIV